MKLSEFFNSGLMFGKKAKLLMDIDLNNGESRNKGDVVSVLKDYGAGYYHIEDNEFACKASDSEIEFIN
jgi:hypothetical protein